MFMANGILAEFARYLLAKYPVPGDLSAKLGSAANGSSGNGQDEPKLRELWELTELSANDFAEEVARFYRLPRLGLPELIAAQSLVARFSRRFLRETMVFPYQRGENDFRLVLADPTD